jgi:hypothetical protein
MASLEGCRAPARFSSILRGPLRGHLRMTKNGGQGFLFSRRMIFARALPSHRQERISEPRSSSEGTGGGPGCRHDHEAVDCALRDCFLLGGKGGTNRRTCGGKTVLQHLKESDVLTIIAAAERNNGAHPPSQRGPAMLTRFVNHSSLCTRAAGAIAIVCTLICLATDATAAPKHRSSHIMNACQQACSNAYIKCCADNNCYCAIYACTPGTYACGTPYDQCLSNCPNK